MQDDRKIRVVEAWLSDKYTLKQIATMNNIDQGTVSRIITEYLNSLKIKK